MQTSCYFPVYIFTAVVFANLDLMMFDMLSMITLYKSFTYLLNCWENRKKSLIVHENKHEKSSADTDKPVRRIYRSVKVTKNVTIR